MKGNIKVTILTFVSGKEKQNVYLMDLAHQLRLNYLVELVEFVDVFNGFTGLQTKKIITTGQTKYARIHQFILSDKSDYILCIDNDIKPDIKKIHTFINESIASEAELSWGKIGVSSTNGIIEKLIKIDKLLSHNIIRPSLWASGFGASLPGQLFLMKASSFRKKLIARDTVFDDLTIGICAKVNNCKTYYVREVLGQEKPKCTLISLLKQRIRWGKGFLEVFCANRDSPKNLLYVLVHGLAYHFLWIAFWGGVYLTSLVSINAALLTWAVMSIGLTFGEFYLVFYAMLYSIAFPFVHVLWMTSVLFYGLIRLPDKKF